MNMTSGTKMILLGLCGKMGCGKDYLANNMIIPYIENILRKKCIQMSFADQIKVNVMAKSGIDYRDVFEQKTIVTRMLLQKEGTENGRNVLGDKIWIKYMDSWIKVYKNRGFAAFVIPDVRFQNEVEYIKSQNGIVVKVVAPERSMNRAVRESGGNSELLKQITSHQSECDLDDLDNINFDAVIRNDIHETPNAYDVFDKLIRHV